MERKILFFPAWDKRDPNPAKDYGVSPLEIYFLLLGERGAVSLELATNWYLPSIMQERLEWMKRDVWQGKEDFLLEHWISPSPLDLFYVSLDKISEDDVYWDIGWKPFQNGAPCYYNYKYQYEKNNKEAKVFAYLLLIEKGDEALWQYLEEYYQEVFGKKEN